MPIRTVDINEAPEQWADLMGLVAQGDEVVLTVESTPVARLVPYGKQPSRKAGLHSGAMSTQEDFDAPLPESYWTGGA